MACAHETAMIDDDSGHRVVADVKGMRCLPFSIYKEFRYMGLIYTGWWPHLGKKVTSGPMYTRLAKPPVKVGERDRRAYFWLSGEGTCALCNSVDIQISDTGDYAPCSTTITNELQRCTPYD